MEHTSAQNNPVPSNQPSEKMKWQVPALTALDLSLVTDDGLLPTIAIPLPSMVS